MKKTWIARLAVIASIVLAVLGPLGKSLGLVVTARADQTTMEVSGEVLENTKDSLLRLRTQNGDMLIKLDDGTDASECKVLYPGKPVTAYVYRGDDAYMHAAKLTSNVGVTNKKTTGETKKLRGTVSGTITEEVITVGDMTFEMDASTNLSELKTVLAQGSHVYVEYQTIDADAKKYYAKKIYTDPDAEDLESKLSEAAYIGRITGDSNDSTLILDIGNGKTVSFSIDTNTDTSQGRAILPNRNVGVEWYTGNDNNIHASMIVGDRTKDSGNVDTNNTVAFSGTVGAETTEDWLYLVTDGGTMQIRLHSNTDMGGAKIFTFNKAITVNCGHGDDNYWHALSVSGSFGGKEYTGGAKSGSIIRSGSSSSSAASTAPTAVAQGQIADGTTTDIINLSTSGGVMQFKLDKTTNLDAARILTTGTNAAVAYYRGSDAYNHASVIVTSIGVATDTATVDTANPYTVTGTVNENSNSNMLYLDTPTGTMQIKIDSTTDMSAIKALTSNAAIKVVCCRGSDAYLHATQITAN